MQQAVARCGSQALHGRAGTPPRRVPALTSARVRTRGKVGASGGGARTARRENACRPRAALPQRPWRAGWRNVCVDIVVDARVGVRVCRATRSANGSRAGAQSERVAHAAERELSMRNHARRVAIVSGPHAGARVRRGARSRRAAHGRRKSCGSVLAPHKPLTRCGTRLCGENCGNRVP